MGVNDEVVLLFPAMLQKKRCWSTVSSESSLKLIILCEWAWTPFTTIIVMLIMRIWHLFCHNRSSRGILLKNKAFVVEFLGLTLP